MGCVTTHGKCGQPDESSSWLPTRLIGIGSPWGLLEPRLVSAAELRKRTVKVPYLCLSHLWAAGTVLKLMRANMGLLKRIITMARLSPPFWEALQMTRRLGVRYLWIGSLYILQDFAEDWITGSEAMGKI